MNKQDKWEEIKTDLKSRLTQAYFAFSEVKKPDFKTADEAKNWYEQHDWIAEKMVGGWVDNTMVVLSEAIITAEERMRQRCLEVLPEKGDLSQVVQESEGSVTPTQDEISFETGFNQAIDTATEAIRKLGK